MWYDLDGRAERRNSGDERDRETGGIGTAFRTYLEDRSIHALVRIE